MKDIFAGLYNKVLSFFSKTDEKSNAKDVACNRLKLVLMQDRTNLTPAIMDRMRRELVELLSKYMELDRELLDLNFEHEDDQMALMLSIPVIRAKNEDEINEILAKEDEEKQKLEELAKAQEESEEESEESENTEETEEKPEEAEETSDSESEESETEEAENSEEEETDDDEEDEEDEEVDEDTKKEKFFSKKKEK
ncbi:MAG: cell division topological specificity factor MinE [Cyanobacteria bacterium RUI128]|nr:cell division topological specificity factor MinE [Cyanobacteria bacterium RUI128]